MPSKQAGRIEKLPSGSWSTRYYDEHGKRRRQGGFATKTAAREWLDNKVKEIAALRRGDAIPVSHRPKTVDEVLDVFVEKHGRNLDPGTLRTDKSALKHTRRAFGDRHPDSLNRLELEDCRVDISPGSRHRAFRVFRQALAWGMARGLIERDASVGISNPKRRRHERRDVLPFESWQEVEMVAAELDTRFQVIPILAVGCGLRPEELFGLHPRRRRPA